MVFTSRKFFEADLTEADLTMCNVLKLYFYKGKLFVAFGSRTSKTDGLEAVVILGDKSIYKQGVSPIQTQSALLQGFIASNTVYRDYHGHDHYQQNKWQPLI